MTKEFNISHCELPIDSNNLPIITVNEFSNEAAIDFKRKMYELESNPYFDNILINVTSYGGQVYAGLSMLDTIKACTKQVIVSVSGYAASFGAILTACGPKGFRYMEPNSRLYFHSVQGGTRGSVEEMDVNIEIFKNLDKLIFDLVTKNSGISYKEFKQTLKEKSGEWELTAKEALKHGFIDHIGTPHFSKSVTTTLTMD